jgi:hypothetical protein
VSARDASVGEAAIHHAAIGPVPSTLKGRIPFKGLSGATIHVTGAALTFYGTESEYAAERRAAAIKAASKATGANYQTVMEQAGY